MKIAAYVTEFIGTFFLVLTIGLVIRGTKTAEPAPLAPIAIGSVLMVMIYMGGHVSGAHYNPAVSVAVLLRGKMTVPDFFIYVVVQLIGGFLAAYTVYVILGKTFAPMPDPEASTTTALLVEILFTFALALVVLNSATAPKTQGNSFYGLAIGFTVLVGAVAGGGVSGGAFNPSVGTGPSLVNRIYDPAGTLKFVWIYWVGPMIGGILAAGVYKLQNPEVVVVKTSAERAEAVSR